MAEICVGNIPYSASEIDVKALLETTLGQGSVVSCVIKRDALQVQHKGFGFVTFGEKYKADIAVCLASKQDHDFVLQNRRLKIGFATGPLKLKNKVRDSNGPTSFDAGTLSLGWLEGGTNFHVSWASNLSVQIEIDAEDLKLSFLVNVKTEDSWVKEYKLQHSIASIQQVLAACNSEGPSTALLFQLWNPPRVFKRMDEIDIWQKEDPELSEWTDVVKVLSLSSGNQDRWFRTTDFTPYCSIGQSLVYVLEFPKIEKNAFKDVLKELRCHFLIPAIKRLVTLSKTQENATPPQLMVPIVSCPKIYNISFQVMFKLNHLVQYGSLPGPLLSDNFFRLLSETPAEAALWVMREHLKFMIRGTIIENPVEWLKEGMHKYGSVKTFPSSALITLDEGLIWVYRLLITPTRVCCMGPEVATSNRVIRQYSHLLENFLRVTFVEEDGDTLPAAAVSLNNAVTAGFQVGRSDIHDRILRVLKEGFSIGGKKYEFLAFSSSQLRQQSMWMFAPTRKVTAESIRSWMGDFMGIKNVAKCAARMGQCFSSSTKTLAVKPKEIEHLPDIFSTGGVDKYCFSDGIGRISNAFATTVAARCGCRDRIPSAFQIRYGGYKGVVAVNPGPSNYKLSLRPSMKKFESNHLYLEVLNWAKPLPCYLNRQVITLLSTLGVQDDVFEQMQRDMVSKFDLMLETNQAAIEVLEATSTSLSHGTVIGMLKSGYSPKAEPYLKGFLEAFRASKFARIRSKARIPVPKGRCLIGCIDETASLAYGEVFLQVSSSLGHRDLMDNGLSALKGGQRNGTYVVTGPVVVTKNPCVHPGDVRVLTAVDNLQLRHMVDCVVFPQRGHRPHPNECSGSDLDGDLYFVSWDQRLIPPTIHAPMNYTSGNEIILNRPVTTEDIQEFFAKYILNDNLGVIANSHTALADKEVQMARDPKCLELARLHSKAVDFPKTGEAAVIPRKLKPQRYPDFMGKEKNVSYKSEKILGKLYRALPVVKTARKPFTKADIVKSFDEDLILEGEGFRNYLDEAWNLKQCYDTKLLSLMNQYGIKTEMEVVTGNIIGLSKCFAKQAGEVKQRIRLAVRSLQKEAKRWFTSGYQSCEGYQIDESIELTEREKLVKASAWYYVSYHRDYVDREGVCTEGEPFISFPWTVYEYLLIAKNGGLE